MVAVAKQEIISNHEEAGFNLPLQVIALTTQLLPEPLKEYQKSTMQTRETSIPERVGSSSLLQRQSSETTDFIYSLIVSETIPQIYKIHFHNLPQWNF